MEVVMRKKHKEMPLQHNTKHCKNVFVAFKTKNEGCTKCTPVTNTVSLHENTATAGILFSQTGLKIMQAFYNVYLTGNHITVKPAYCLGWLSLYIDQAMGWMTMGIKSWQRQIQTKSGTNPASCSMRTYSRTAAC